MQLNANCIAMAMEFGHLVLPDEVLELFGIGKLLD